MSGDTAAVESFLLHKRKQLLALLPHVADLHDIFVFFDKKGVGHIEVGQFGECLRDMSLEPSEMMLETSLVELANSTTENRQSLRITFELLLAVYCALFDLRDQLNTDELMHLFHFFDVSGTGTLRYTQLHHCLTTVGQPLNEAELSALLEDKTDQHGNVNYMLLLQEMSDWEKYLEEQRAQAHKYLDIMGRCIGPNNMEICSD